MAFALENTKFYLQFMDASSAPSFEIAEPIGFDALNFQLKQDTNRIGRDVTFAEEPLEFSSFVNTRGLTHQFDRLIGFYNTKGFEARVLFKVEISGQVYVLGQLDYLTCETDRINYFRTSIIQDLLESRIKRNASVKVDLYSNTPIFGETAFSIQDFSGLMPEKILLQSLPLEQRSSWRKPEEINFDGIIISPGNGFSFSPFAQIVDFEIENTLSPSTQLWNFDGRDDYTYLEAQNTLTEVEMTLSGGNWNFNGDTGFSLAYRKGVDFDDSTPQVLQMLPATGNNYENTWQLPSMERGERLWIYIRRVEGTGQTFTFTSGEISIDTVSTAVSSVTDGIRIGDAMKQIVRSIANADFDAPRFLENGRFENQFIFKGNQLRLLRDKPFTLSFNDCISWLRSEVNGDYQVMPDGSVFVGLETDFYKNTKIGEFLMSPSDTYSESINDKFAINKVEWKYQKYEQGNNGDESNSLESIHTESEYFTRNGQVENTKTIEVPFIRDAFLLEKTRKASVFETENTARSEDEDTFIVDAIPGSRQLEETFLLSHSLSGVFVNVLTLTNNGSFNFEISGFEVGMTVQVVGENQAIYEVLGVAPTKIALLRQSPGSGDFTGIVLTKLIWTPNVNFTNRTGEGIAFLFGTKVPFSNMLWSIPRNLTQYYGRYLKTSLRYYPTSQLRNTFFRNGAEVRIDANANVFGSNGKQNKPLNVSQLPAPILTDKMITTEVSCNFSDFWDFLIKLREDFGYCEVKRTNGVVTRIFPTELVYNWQEFRLTITGEEQAEQSQSTTIVT